MSDSQFILKEETHRIIGSAMEVLNELGHGFHEKIYENALVVEFGFGCRHQDDRADHGPRDRKNAKLPKNNGFSGRPAVELQTRKT
nr:GxxExxY protein [Roseimaritima ulvae]